MYAEAGLLFPYFQSFLQEVQHLEDFSRFHKSNAISNLVQTSTVSEYDLGGEGDLFKAPEPIIEESVLDLDPMAAAISMISSAEDVFSSETMKVTDIESIQSGNLMSEVFYECKRDLLEKSAIEELFPQLSDVKVPSIPEGASNVEKDGSFYGGPFQKSVSSASSSSMEWIDSSCTIRPSFLDFQTMDLRANFGMRRAYSEGDIQTLDNGNTSFARSHFEKMLTIGNYTIEERKQKLSRYRKKKSKRNFGRKIKYACRKALAESQPRVRGRFAKIEETCISKASELDGSKYSKEGQDKCVSQTTSYNMVEEYTKMENPSLSLHESISGSLYCQEAAINGSHSPQW